MKNNYAPAFKRTVVGFAFAALVTFMASEAFAQNSATANGTASARIVGEAIQVTGESDINFGGISIDNPELLTGGTVEVDATVDPPILNPTGNITLIGGGSFGPAEFTITGDPHSTFGVYLPLAPGTALHDQGPFQSGITQLVISEFNTNLDLVGDALDSAGSATVRIGGTLQVPFTAKTGGYSSAITITVFYM